MNTNDLIAEVADKIGTTRAEAGRIVDTILGLMIGTLKRGEPVQIMGFGQLYPVRLPERLGRDPQANKEIMVPSCVKIRWKAGRTLKAALNEPQQPFVGGDQASVTLEVRDGSRLLVVAAGGDIPGVRTAEVEWQNGVPATIENQRAAG